MIHLVELWSTCSLDLQPSIVKPVISHKCNIQFWDICLSRTHKNTLIRTALHCMASWVMGFKHSSKDWFSRIQELYVINKSLKALRKKINSIEDAIMSTNVKCMQIYNLLSSNFAWKYSDHTSLVFWDFDIRSSK